MFRVFCITIQYGVAILEHICFKNKMQCYISRPDTNPYDWGATIPTYFTHQHKRIQVAYQHVTTQLLFTATLTVSKVMNN
jgi:aromatic ring-opening dioxygenase LigB subunit